MVKHRSVTCVLIVLRRLVITTSILAIVLVIAVNTRFNMKGHWLMPAPVSSGFEEIKTLLRGSPDDRNKTRTSTIGKVSANRTLVGVYEGLRRNFKRLDSTSESKISKRNVTYHILWYKRPAWINLDFANNVLSSFKCTYNNCLMSMNVSNLSRYAAIVFSFTHKLNLEPPIPRANRSRDQVWIFFGLESPINHNKIAYRHENWKNTMNWSMSYRRDADIFTPYGMLEKRKEQRDRNYSAIFSRKTKQAAWLVSNCGAASNRDEFVSELQKYGLHVDIFGVCVNNVFLDRSEILSIIDKDYKYFLSFENSLCKDYVTEKFFRYYNLDVVLVVRGGADYDHDLPNDTFINSAHFGSPKALANYLLEVGASEELFTDYLKNKDRYIASEMFTMPTSYCSICEKLNHLNENRKMYEDHVSFIHDNTCWTATDVSLRMSMYKNYILTTVLSLLVITFCIAVKRECCAAGHRCRSKLC